MKVSRRWEFQGCFMIFKGVPRVFLSCFKEVSRKLCVSKKFHVAWHSSQLPEQKEDLIGINKFLSLKMLMKKFSNRNFLGPRMFYQRILCRISRNTIQNSKVTLQNLGDILQNINEYPAEY